MTTRYEPLDTTIYPLGSHGNDLARGVSKLSDQVDKLTIEKRTLKMENADLTKEIGLLRASHAETRDSNIKLFHELTAIAADLAKLEKERDAYKARVEELERLLNGNSK